MKQYERESVRKKEEFLHAFRKVPTSGLAEHPKCNSEVIPLTRKSFLNRKSVYAVSPRNRAIYFSWSPLFKSNLGHYRGYMTLVKVGKVWRGLRMAALVVRPNDGGQQTDDLT